MENSITGRIKKIKKTKNNIFIIIENDKQMQIVVKPNNYSKVENIKLGDIIECQVTEDSNNCGKYKSLIPTYLLIDIRVISARIKEFCKNYSFERLKEYSDAKNRVRNFLSDKDYIEVHIPVLTNGETSSKATSFETIHSKSGEKLFLRKTMDSFLRILSCGDVNKIFSFGPCFRNEHVTSLHMPEFEMLSIFTNYMSIDEGMLFSIQVLKTILGKDVEVKIIDSKDYRKNIIDNNFYLITNLKNELDSYANINENGITNEFKIKYNGTTLIHGVMEIQNIEEYKSKLQEQGKKENYGELQVLEDALSNGAPPCFNMGINIIRTLAFCNELKIKDYDAFAFSRFNFKNKKEE